MKNAIVVGAVVLMTAACASTDTADQRSMTSASTASSMNIAEVAMSTGMHNTLVAALKSAGLANMLMESGSYTVFAPTDAAFAKLPAGTVEMLMRPENRDKLRSILQYHVVPGRVSAQQVSAMTSAKSASGQTLRISTMNDQVMIGNAHVVKADVAASNGVVHVIDTVLMPPGM
ncbi:MAG TPA: fasciclin domain-containing protein [Thermoanaerobaculia bacterium]